MLMSSMKNKSFNSGLKGCGSLHRFIYVTMSIGLGKCCGPGSCGPGGRWEEEQV